MHVELRLGLVERVGQRLRLPVELLLLVAVRHELALLRPPQVAVLPVILGVELGLRVVQRRGESVSVTGAPGLPALTLP